MSVTMRFRETMDDDRIADLSARNPGLRFERARDGRLIASPTGSESGRRNAELTRQVANWSSPDRGVVFDSSTGFALPDGSLLSPDAAWIRAERWDALGEAEREGYAPMCPDVVFEVRSASDDLREMREKGRRYLENGATLVAIVDPFERNVILVRASGERVASGASIAFDPELAGFVLETRGIFR